MCYMFCHFSNFRKALRNEKQIPSPWYNAAHTSRMLESQQQQNTNKMSTRPTIFNPYARRHCQSAPNIAIMGRQSQHRLSQQKRTYQLAASNSPNKKKKGEQLTLQGGVAFKAERDCVVCKAKATRRFTPNFPIPHRKHHVLCLMNTKTKGKGELSEHAQQSMKESQRLQALFSKPLEAHEKGSWKHSTKEAGDKFFQPQSQNKKSPPTKMVVLSGTQSRGLVSADELCLAVTELVNDSSFNSKHSNKMAPLAMIAFASVVVDKIVNSKNIEEIKAHFNGLTMTVPASFVNHDCHYHSIVGERLLLVDWKRLFGLRLKCPEAKCDGELQND
jgi:hypothetical protein